MTAYLLSVSGAVFLSVTISFIIPDGKLNKMITFVLRLVCILIIVSPITSIFKIDDGQVEVAADLEFVTKVYAQNQGRALEENILNEFSIEVEVDVEIEYKEGEFIERGVVVKIKKENEENISEIYEYLQSLEYINITVYADA